MQLPSRYLKTQWRPLLILLGPVMTVMWLSTSLLIWALAPGLPFLHALAIGACVTPTDPILSNVIVKGKFADHNVPKDLQRIIIAESGANDGLGYPFLFLALYLIKYIDDGGASVSGGAGMAMGLWFGETWGYTIILSVIYGATVGWIAKELLHCKLRTSWAWTCPVPSRPVLVCVPLRTGLQGRRSTITSTVRASSSLLSPLRFSSWGLVV